METSASTMEKILHTRQFVIFYRQSRPSRWTTESQNDYKAIIVLRGEANYSMNDQPLKLNKGGALLLSPNETATVATDEDAELLALTLAPSFVFETAVSANLARSEARIFFHTQLIAQDEKLSRLASDLKSELVKAEAGRDVVTKAVVDQMVVHLLRRYANFRRSDELELSRAGLVDRRIRRAVELMHTHLDRELQLEEIAASAYLSPFHFARLFKKLMGASPHAYLAQLRQARAQTLLAETDLSVTSISQMVGYASSSHFTKAFRQRTGLTPRGFRQALVHEGKIASADRRSAKHR